MPPRRPYGGTPCSRPGYGHETVCHARGEYARDNDGDGFCEAHVDTMKGV